MFKKKAREYRALQVSHNYFDTKNSKGNYDLENIFELLVLDCFFWAAASLAALR